MKDLEVNQKAHILTMLPHFLIYELVTIDTSKYISLRINFDWLDCIFVYVLTKFIIERMTELDLGYILICM